MSSDGMGLDIENVEKTVLRATHIMDLNEIAMTFGVDKNTIQLWCSNGMPKLQRDTYDFVECSLWKIKQLQNDLMIARNSVDDELHQEKIKGQRLDNQQRELKLEREAKRLVPVVMVRYAWHAEMKKISRAMKNVVNKILHAVEASGTDTIKLRDSVERLINEIKEGIATDLSYEMPDDDDEDLDDDVEVEA